MKKMMLMAAVACMTMSVQAQNPAAVKQVMGTKDYKEAKNLVETNLSGMDNEEKAKVWNKVVDLALDKFNNEQNTMLTNQVTKKEGGYDKEGMYDAAKVAVQAAMECEKYDQLPNAKGKVKVKFHKANQDRLVGARTALINAGQEAYNNKDFKGASELFGAYVDCKGNPLYSDFDFSKDQYMGQVAYFASLAAYNAQDYPAASRYAGVALGDTAVAKDAMDIKVLAMKAQLKTKEDSINYLNDIKELYAQDPSNERMFSLLAEYYQATGDEAARKSLLEEQVAKYPGKMSWALKGESEMGEQKWMDAINSYKKSLEFDPEFIQVQFNLALCQNNQAITLKDANNGNLTAEAKSLLQESVKNLNEIKAKDPDHLTVNWPYTLYQAYYLLGDEANAKALESIIGK